MSEIAEQTAEIVAENVEEAIDGVVETLEVVRTNKAAVVVGIVAGLAVGAAGGYFFAARKLGKEFDERLIREIEDTKAFYAGVHKVDEDGAVLTPQQVLQKTHPEAAEALRAYQGEAPAATEEELLAQDEEMDERQLQRIEERSRREVEVPETVNVFNDPSFDLVEEKKHRSKDKPYVISHDEYFNSSEDYENQALTYFETDDTLVNENDNPVDDVDSIIGDEALARFGHGSKDKNVVYVRNDRLEMDFEVTLSPGSYLEALGLGPEPDSLMHSNRNTQQNRRREFRRGMG